MVGINYMANKCECDGDGDGDGDGGIICDNVMVWYDMYGMYGMYGMK